MRLIQTQADNQDVVLQQNSDTHTFGAFDLIHSEGVCMGMCVKVGVGEPSSLAHNMAIHVWWGYCEMFHQQGSHTHTQCVPLKCRSIFKNRSQEGLWTYWQYRLKGKFTWGNYWTFSELLSNLKWRGEKCSSLFNIIRFWHPGGWKPINISAEQPCLSH